MNSEAIWLRLQEAFGNQKAFWMPEELAVKPGVMDRVLHYLISYYENPAVARNAVRVFRGIDTFSGAVFSGWNEVRVSTLREINEALTAANAKGETWELAITIKDFLNNTWNTLDTLDLDTIPEDAESYLQQLKATPNSWEIQVDENKKTKTQSLETPLRYSFDNFYKQYKKYRTFEDQVLPGCVIDFLRYTWKFTTKPPFENHTNRILVRLGLFEEDAPYDTKLSKFNEFVGDLRPVSKHKRLLQLGKVVCFSSSPRCTVCPVNNDCSKNGI